MTNFDRLHPALQFHIVNSLGWRSLRPFQEEVIPAIVEGKHAMILAPTAGGKTEAAIFPLLSRMLEENWKGLSILYVCPLRALLNNLHPRLTHYCDLIGRRSGIWHGDVKTSARRHIQRDPPDIILITPESLEVMLVSQSIDGKRILANVRAVVVDEIHAFVGDDRGWHLLSVLARIARITEKPIQRVGLSATVGNPEVLLEWLAGAEPPENRVLFLPGERQAGDADVKIDFVGSLDNAAVVISRMHRGDKRLVFVDSRAGAEKLGHLLRQMDTTTFVIHSSLSREHRHAAETGFAERNNCVMIATSALELGIDIGDLDQVIQINSPSTVSSFLQRMGRTGRRAGTRRSCLFLATNANGLLCAAALEKLRREGFVEPAIAPPLPYHIFAQQLMALSLQEGGIEPGQWPSWLGAVPAFDSGMRTATSAIIDYMLERNILWEDAGRLFIGDEGARKFGRRHFMELLSVFTAAPLFLVRQGRQEIGYVEELLLLARTQGERLILLSGNSWRVTYIDWQRRVAHVEPAEARGRAQWIGAGTGLSYQVCQAIRSILVERDAPSLYSKRAQEKIAEMRLEFSTLPTEGSLAQMVPGEDAVWWTFAGLSVNSMLVAALSPLLQASLHSDDFKIEIPVDSLERLRDVLQSLREKSSGSFVPLIDEDALDGLKFSVCLPPDLAMTELEGRASDFESLGEFLAGPIEYVLGN